MKTYSRDGLPAPVMMSAGHKVAMETVGVGEIIYECRARTGDGHEWVVVGPDAELMDRSGKQIGRYQADYIFYKAS